MWIALRPFRYRDVSYKTGDRVPAENWSNRRAFFVTRRIKEVAEPAAQPAAPGNVESQTPQAAQSVDPTKLKRPELNDHAASLGIDSPEAFPNIPTLLAAVTAATTPSAAETPATPVVEAPVVETPPSVETPPKVEEEDPFADLEKKD